MSYFFGLYFGNTNLCLAAYKDGKIEAIANAAGDRVTPAYVSIFNGERLVGLPAKQGMVRNAINTMTNVKSLLNREDDVADKSKCKVSKENGAFFYQIEIDGEVVRYSTSEACEYLFKVMAGIAKSYCHKTDIPVVITVPLEYNSTEVSNCATNAGFSVLRVVSEPAAAALAYEVGQSAADSPCHCIVYRMGGTSVDVTALRVVRGIYHVLANIRINDLGGNHFTSLLANFCASEFKKQYKADIKENKRSVIKLNTAAENCKHVLSTMRTAQCFSESIYDGIDLSINVSQARFESLIGNLMQQCLEPVKEVLKKASITEEDIDKLVLAGGSCKIPKLQQQLTDMFPSSTLLNSISPDEVIAVGAAIQGEIIGQSEEISENDCFVKVLSREIYSVVVTDGEKSTISLFPKGTPIPAFTTQSLTLDNSILHIDIYEHSGKDMSKGLHLAKLLTPVASTKQFTLTARLSKDGILEVSCNDNEAQVENSLTVMPKSD